MKNYLSEEKQYEKSLNPYEIRMIKDPELQAIRSKYRDLRHKAFLDEHEIPDTEIGSVFEELYRKEAMEIETYKKKKASEKNLKG